MAQSKLQQLHDSLSSRTQRYMTTLLMRSPKWSKAGILVATAEWRKNKGFNRPIGRSTEALRDLRRLGVVSVDNDKGIVVYNPDFIMPDWAK